MKFNVLIESLTIKRIHADRGKSLPLIFASIFLLAAHNPVAHAAAPGLDGWSVTGGNVAAPCPAGAVSCEDPILDNGFMMRKVVMPGAIDYWQFVMTDPYATGMPGYDPFASTLTFTNESFIRADNTSGTTSGGSEQIQKTMVAESLMNGNIEDRWSQVAQVQTGLGWHISFEEKITTIDWSAGALSPVVLFDSTHRAKGNLGSFGGVKDFNQVLTQDIWQGTDLTQKFQYQVDRLPNNHTAGVGTPLLAGGSNGGDISTGGLTNNLLLKATYVGQSVASSSETPSLFSFTSFRNQDSKKPETTSNITELSSLKTADPLVSNFNRLFTFDGSFTYGPDPIFPSNVYSINPSISATAPTVTQTLLTTGPPVDVAVVAQNDNVASPLSGGGGTGGPPIDLGSWTVTGGVVNVDPCPATVICGPITVGPGFMQRQITVVADGSTYFQIVITDSDATGNTSVAPTLSSEALNGEIIPVASVPESQFVPPPSSDPFVPGVLRFANETIVKRGGNGIANSTQVADIHRRGTNVIKSGGNVTGYVYAPAEAMAQRIKLNTGWAEGTGAAPVVEIKQLTGIDDSNQANSSDNALASNMFMGWRAGSQFDFIKAANGATDYTVVSVPSQNKANGLYMRKIDGGLQTTSHTLADTTLIPGGTNGGNIAWNVGDSIQALWWGDSYNFYSGTAKNSFVAYTNLTTGDRTSREQSQSAPLAGPVSRNQSGAVSTNPPAAWVAPFNTPAPPELTNNTVYWTAQPQW